jgi:hypothetical protein
MNQQPDSYSYFSPAANKPTCISLIYKQEQEFFLIYCINQEKCSFWFKKIFFIF